MKFCSGQRISTSNIPSLLLHLRSFLYTYVDMTGDLFSPPKFGKNGESLRQVGYSYRKLKYSSENIKKLTYPACTRVPSMIMAVWSQLQSDKPLVNRKPRAATGRCARTSHRSASQRHLSTGRAAIERKATAPPLD
jgi:hypothetical protein